MKWLVTTAFALLLAACGTPAPAPRLVQLPIDAPAAAPAAAQAAAAVWEIAGDIRLPAAIDREAVLLQEPGAALRVLPARWAEPLRDAVPRVLLNDLALLRGADRVWRAPAPPGVAVAARLRVELLALGARSDRNAVVLQARWWLEPRGGAAPAVRDAVLDVPCDTGDAAAVAAAHRRALWLLAERIAAPA